MVQTPLQFITRETDDLADDLRIQSVERAEPSRASAIAAAVNEALQLALSGALFPAILFVF